MCVFMEKCKLASCASTLFCLGGGGVASHYNKIYKCTCISCLDEKSLSEMDKEVKNVIKNVVLDCNGNCHFGQICLSTAVTVSYFIISQLPVLDLLWLIDPSSFVEGLCCGINRGSIPQMPVVCVFIGLIRFYDQFYSEFSGTRITFLHDFNDKIRKVNIIAIMHSVSKS